MLCLNPIGLLVDILDDCESAPPPESLPFGDLLKGDIVVAEEDEDVEDQDEDDDLADDEDEDDHEWEEVEDDEDDDLDDEEDEDRAP